MPDFKLGKLPPDPSKPKLKLGPRLLGTVTPSPATRDWLTAVPTWPMYGNDRYGDCVFAMTGHFIQAVTTYAKGVETRITTTDVLKAYSDVTGFVATDPSTDNGTVMQDAMDYWRKTGIGGRKILAFASVDATNLAEVHAAINIFGAALIGFNFPAFAWDQFDAGKPWDVSSTNTAIEGGHAVHVGWYDDPNNLTKLTTWGQVQGMTEAFWSRYVDEVWVVITEDWLDVNGRNPSGVDLYGLGEDFAALTGQSNPFPAPAPQPVPVDHEVPTEADRALLAAALIWETHGVRLTWHKQFRAALDTWRHAKGS